MCVRACLHTPRDPFTDSLKGADFSLVFEYEEKKLEQLCVSILVISSSFQGIRQ